MTTFNVFVSMPFRDKTREDIQRYLHYAEKYFRNRIDGIRDDDIVVPLCAWYDKNDPDAPKYPEGQNKRLNDLARAINIMASCNGFIMFTRADGSIPNGCNIELMAWVNSGNMFNCHEPIILNGGLVK